MQRVDESFNGASLSRSNKPRRRAPRPSLLEIKERAYRFSDLSRYDWRDRILIRAADLFFYFLIKLICRSARWEVRGMHHLESILADGRRAIFTSWHACIFGATWFWRNRGIVVMSSQSRDGEFTGRFIKRFGYGTARGSSARRAGRALVEMAECLESGIDVGFTIDGPRGPALLAKTGAVTIARHTGQAILPFHVAPRRFVSLGSWDRMEIPLPFTRMVVLIAEPIYVGRQADTAEVGRAQATLQSSLDQLRRQADEWRGGARQAGL
jgi:lysophospholipid acyltransferase (LPLAT)-like uncharacterized protein